MVVDKNTQVPLALLRPVVPGCAMAHPDFGRSINFISTRGDRLCPPNYYLHTQIFRPSDSPVHIPCCFLAQSAVCNSTAA